MRRPAAGAACAHSCCLFSPKRCGGCLLHLPARARGVLPRIWRDACPTHQTRTQIDRHRHRRVHTNTHTHTHALHNTTCEHLRAPPVSRSPGCIGEPHTHTCKRVATLTPPQPHGGSNSLDSYHLRSRAISASLLVKVLRRYRSSCACLRSTSLTGSNRQSFFMCLITCPRRPTKVHPIERCKHGTVSAPSSSTLGQIRKCASSSPASNTAPHSLGQLTGALLPPFASEGSVSVWSSPSPGELTASHDACRCGCRRKVQSGLGTWQSSRSADLCHLLAWAVREAATGGSLTAGWQLCQCAARSNA